MTRIKKTSLADHLTVKAKIFKNLLFYLNSISYMKNLVLNSQGNDVKIFQEPNLDIIQIQFINQVIHKIKMWISLLI